MANKKARVVPTPYAVPQSIMEAAEYQRQMATILSKMEARDNLRRTEQAKLDEAAERDLAPLRAEVHGRAVALFAFAKANREELLPSDKKSFELPHAGRIRWYNSSGAIKIVGKATKERVLKIFTEIRKLGWGKSFIRLSPSLNKDAMLADEESRAKASRVPGLKVLYGEFCELVPPGAYRVVLGYSGDISIEPKEKKKTIPPEADAA